MLNENLIIKDWRNIDLSFGLIYPNIPKIGMSSYSIRLLYSLINSFDNIVCERFFLPENISFPASNDFSPNNRLLSLENNISPQEFDVLGFSIQFENDFRNVLWILEKAGIPFKHEERMKSLVEDEKIYPIIIGGGPVSTSNPMPLSKFFDLFFIGDSEPNLEPFLKIALRYKTKKINFAEFLNETKMVEGIYVPPLKNKVKRVILRDLDKSPIPNIQTLSRFSNQKGIFEENFFVEVNRGCPYQCKFCISSFHNTPFRNRSYENITYAIEKGIIYNNFKTISLIGSCVSAHPKFKEICELVVNSGKNLTIPSIRIDHLTSELIEILVNGGIKTITIAPESGSEKLRYELGKKISNDKIFSVLEEIHRSKIENVKFYFLIGLPNETERDINEIIEFLKKIDNLGFKKDALRVNINPLIPKLNTPYEKKVEFYLDDNLKELLSKFKKIQQGLKNISSIKLKFKNLKNIINNAKLQTIFSLGDENISDLIINYYVEGATIGAFRRAEKELNFSVDDYLKRIKSCYTPWAI